MTGNHSDGPILRRIFATTHQRDSDGSMSNTTAASFHSCKSTITHVESRWIVVNGGASDGCDIEEDNQIEEMEGAEDIPENDDDTSQIKEIKGAEDIPANNLDDDIQIEEILEGAEDIPAKNDDSPIHRTYRFDNCHVYMNSFNARGVKVKNCGNNAPRVTRSMSCSSLCNSHAIIHDLTHIVRSLWHSSQ